MQKTNDDHVKNDYTTYNYLLTMHRVIEYNATARDNNHHFVTITITNRRISEMEL